MLLQQIRETLTNTDERGDSFLRALAAYPNWFLAVDKHNCACLWEINGKQTIGVMTERNGPDGEPREYLEMRGRHLMANLPEETEAIGFDMGTDRALGIQGELLGRLKNIALALGCEEAISAPNGPSGESDITVSVDKIIEHKWIVLWNKKQPRVMPYKGLQGVMLFTAFDTIDAFLSRQPKPSSFQVTHMPGKELFSLLNGRSDFDGVFVNAGSDLELYPLSPAQIHDLANGKQPRLERRILRARGLAELNHFLDECGMGADRPHANETVCGQQVVHYTGDIMPGVEQRSFWFYPVPENKSSDQWGAGPSEIVCAGRLADLLRRRLEILEAEPKPLSSDLSKFVQTGIIWANELKKLIDPRTGRLPRRLFRTADGARFIREFPPIATRDFVDVALAKLQSYQVPVG
ncbi:MAG: hypothetical protein JST89_13290 [Cyanobacteria bacterium SZAS-4]|nr:hypothetical protein [Cyanobacteria bacterium SZAS-4]